MADYNNALKLNPKNENIYFNRGISILDKGNLFEKLN